MEPKVEPRQNLKLPQWWLYAIWGVMLFAALQFASHAVAPKDISYSEFRDRLSKGEVTSVEISSAMIWLRLKEPVEKPPALRTVRVEDPSLLKDLQDKGVAVTGVSPPSVWAWVLPWVLPGVLLLVLFGVGRNRGGVGMLSAARSANPRLYAERGIGVKFGDVAGVEEAKRELVEVLDFLRSPDKFTKVGGKLPKGILLVGPPGTGKTLLARAVAGEANVPFFSISGSEFVELFVGVGAARVRDLFEKARQTAPCIIFIDELDALGKARGSSGMNANEEREQTLNQLLVELDGFDPRTGVVLMAATNRPEVLDAALLRAGRFDRTVVIDRPDRKGRREILEVHARKIPLAPDADLDAVAALTPGVAGADLANLLNEAALQAVRNNRDRIGRVELDEAVERTIAGTARTSRALSPADKQRVAHHEAGHAIVARYLTGVDPVRKISILPRGVAALGYTLQTPSEERMILTRSALENRIAVLMGGRVAEKLWLDEVSTGAQDDLVRATQIARAMVRAYGMSQTVGPMSLEHMPSTVSPFERQGHERHDESEALSQQVDREVRLILELQEQRVTELLARESGTLMRLVRALLEREVLNGDDLAELLGPAVPAGDGDELPAVV